MSRASKVMLKLLQAKLQQYENRLQKLPVGTTATLYFRDLGAQISWVTVSAEPSSPAVSPPGAPRVTRPPLPRSS